MSTALPPTSIPTSSAIVVSSVAVKLQRTSAASPYPSRIPKRFGEASSSRLPKPPSKSRAMPKPVKTPPNAADWSRTKTNWNDV